MAELQRAVAMAERRALDSVAGERIKMELLLETAAHAQQAKRISAAAAVATAAAATTTKDDMTEAEQVNTKRIHVNLMRT